MLPDDVLKRTVVVQTAFLGDLVLTIPLLRALKRRKARFLAVVATPETAGALARESCVDEVLLYDKRGAGGTSSSRFNASAATLRSKAFSCAIIPHRSLRSAFLAMRAGIGVRVGFDAAPAAALYTARVRYHYALPEAQRNIMLLKAFYNESEREIADGDGWFAPPAPWNAGDPVRIAIAPGSQWRTKRWHAERFAGLAAWCVAQGWRVVLCGASSDERLCEEISRSARTPEVENRCGTTSVAELMDLLRGATALVTNDSAPAHLANVLGVPVVAIFGPTVPEFGFAPRGEFDQIVQTEGLLCKPCTVHGGARCPLGTHECMNEIPVARVARALDRAVELRRTYADRAAE